MKLYLIQGSYFSISIRFPHFYVEGKLIYFGTIVVVFYVIVACFTVLHSNDMIEYCEKHKCEKLQKPKEDWELLKLAISSVH